ncbi:hypothetical protein PCE1_002974 [Barthelona sp. PCE]
MPRRKGFEGGMHVQGLVDCVVTDSCNTIWLHDGDLQFLDIFNLNDHYNCHFMRMKHFEYPIEMKYELFPTLFGNEAYFRVNDLGHTESIVKVSLTKNGPKILNTYNVSLESSAKIAFGVGKIYHEADSCDDNVLALYTTPLISSQRNEKQLLAESGCIFTSSIIQNQTIIDTDHSRDIDGALIDIELFDTYAVIPGGNCLVTMYLKPNDSASFLYDGVNIEPIPQLLVDYLASMMNDISFINTFCVLVYQKDYQLFCFSSFETTNFIDLSDEGIRCIASISGTGNIAFNNRPKVNFSHGLDLRELFQKELQVLNDSFYSFDRIVSLDNVYAILDPETVRKYRSNFIFGDDVNVIINVDEKRVYLKGSNEDKWNDFVNSVLHEGISAQDLSNGLTNRIMIKAGDAVCEWTSQADANEHFLMYDANGEISHLNFYTQMFCCSIGPNKGLCVFSRDKRYEIEFYYDNDNVTITNTTIFDEESDDLMSNPFNPNYYIYTLNEGSYVRDIAADRSVQLKINEEECIGGCCGCLGFFTDQGIYKMSEDFSIINIVHCDVDIDKHLSCPGENVVEEISYINREIVVRSISEQGEKENRYDILMDFLSVFEVKLI